MTSLTKGHAAVGGSVGKLTLALGMVLLGTQPPCWENPTPYEEATCEHSGRKSQLLPTCE